MIKVSSGADGMQAHAGNALGISDALHSILATISLGKSVELFPFQNGLDVFLSEAEPDLLSFIIILGLTFSLLSIFTQGLTL